jgi:hypothetical protein
VEAYGLLNLNAQAKELTEVGCQDGQVRLTSLRQTGISSNQRVRGARFGGNGTGRAPSSGETLRVSMSIIQAVERSATA